MDNIQDPVQEAPKGQAEPTGEQVPNVQTGNVESDISDLAPSGKTWQEYAASKGWEYNDSTKKIIESYAHVEAHSTKVSQDKAELERQFFNSNPNERQIQAKRQELTAQGDETALAELDNFVQQRVNQEISKIRAEFQDKESRRELRETIEKNSDFGKYAEDVKNIKQQYPTMSFSDALMFAKAQKGDLQKEAKMQGMTKSAQALAQQQQAQTSPPKSSVEQKVGVSELLEGASKRWAPSPRGIVDSRAVAEIEQIEKELFGQVLDKTSSGL